MSIATGPSGQASDPGHFQHGLADARQTLNRLLALNRQNGGVIGTWPMTPPPQALLLARSASSRLATLYIA